MKKIHILIYGIYLVILTLCANAFPILSKNLAFLWLFIPIFTVLSRTGAELNCLTAITFRVFRRAFTRKVNTLLRKIPPKSIKN